MIRLALLLSVLASAVVAQTAPSEQPGQWISVPRDAASVMEAPVSGPMIPIESAPVVALSAPEIAAVTALPVAAPDTRPIPRPRALDVIETPDAALDVGAAAPVSAPAPRPAFDDAVGVVDTLAAKVAAVAPFAALPMQTITWPSTVPESAGRAPLRVGAPPVAIPVLTTTLPVQRTVTSVTLLPASRASTRSWIQPVAFNVPPLETTPILPRLSPSGAYAVDEIVGLAAVHSVPFSAVLLPTPSTPSARVPQLARARALDPDRFPLSALPPSSLAEGPDSLSRVIQPPSPFAESNAAVLAGSAFVIPMRMPLPDPVPMPLRDLPAADPEAPIRLPAPDPAAVARMMNDAMICWRMASLPPETRWARVSVDVALDETNMPSAQSIRLTGFARVVSSAAEDAYRAAQSALVGCAEASESAPVTSPTTLVFDRDGVRLQ